MYIVELTAKDLQDPEIAAQVKDGKYLYSGENLDGERIKAYKLKQPIQGKGISNVVFSVSVP